MTHQANVQPAETPIGWAIGQAVDKVRHVGARLREVFAACRTSWEAAALYEDLSRFSDAELERRGIPRPALHRCVFEALGSSASTGDQA